MRKYGKWVLTLGLLAATPGLTLAAGAKSKSDDKPAAESKATSKEENQKLANEVAKAMRNKRIQGDISIEVKNGVAILSGSVADPKIKDKATEAVSKVHGIARVENRLQAAPPKATAEAARPAAESARGVVSANHTAAPAKANRVQQVNNEMPAPSNNQEIAEQIAAGLTAASLDGYDIQIRFQNGVCLLDGSVGTQAERATAQKVVSSVPGVRSVANRLSCANEPAQQRMPQGQYGPGQMAPGQMPPQGSPYPPQGQYPQGGPQQPGMYPVNFRQGEAPAPGGGPVPGGPGGPPMGAMPMGPGGQMPPMPPTYGHPGMGASQAVYNNPSVPDYAWPSYAQYPNSAAVNYPTQYSASAFPYIGPFYPYPQVPLGWRDATLRWDDGQWNLMFRTRTDKWWWYFNPSNW